MSVRVKQRAYFDLVPFFVCIRSFCNEVGCEGSLETGGPAFQAITEQLDGSRPTLANMFTYNDLLSHTIDVQGFSHQSRETVDSCHRDMPTKPIFMSECCSCTTQRGEDESGNDVESNFNAGLTQKASPLASVVSTTYNLLIHGFQQGVLRHKPTRLMVWPMWPAPWSGRFLTVGRLSVGLIGYDTHTAKLCICDQIMASHPSVDGRTVRSFVPFCISVNRLHSFHFFLHCLE